MSGENAPVLDIPPGVARNGTPYSVGRRWWDVNWVRWVNGELTPIGGWVKGRKFGTPDSLLGEEWQGLGLDFASNVSTKRTATAGEMAYGTTMESVETIRDAFSWRDGLTNGWYAVGMESKLQVASPSEAIGSIYDITPSGLNFARTTSRRGYGLGPYSNGLYGRITGYADDSKGLWSMDNFGRILMAVHSTDGRLFSWDPITPSTIAAPVTNAPIDNGLVVVTDERMVMVMGGKNNPRRVKWSDRENPTSWSPSATNTAGGFELNSAGKIVAAVRVQGGILVLTDVDAHMIEYVGAPYYYARRRLSEEVGCIGKNALVGVTGMAFWLSNEGFWKYDGNVTPLQSEVDTDVLHNGDLSDPANVFLGYNGFNREIWAFYPAIGSTAPDRYVFVSIAGAPYWSKGQLSRTAWLNPVWDTKPMMFLGRDEYQHELGLLADGASRTSTIFALTGEFEIGNGEQIMHVDRIYPDGKIYNAGTDPSYTSDYQLKFNLRQAPSAPVRTIGPVSLNNARGFSDVRFCARQISIRVEPVADSLWSVGKLRLRMKAGGER